MKPQRTVTGWAHVAAMHAAQVLLPPETHPPAKVHAARLRIMRALVSLANKLEAARDARPKPWRQGIEPTPAECRDARKACEEFRAEAGLPDLAADVLATYVMMKSGELALAAVVERDGRALRARLMRKRKARR